MADMKQDSSLSLFNYVCICLLCGIIISMWVRGKQLKKRVVFLEEQVERIENKIKQDE